MDELIFKIIFKVRELFMNNSELREYVMKPAKIHLDEYQEGCIEDLLINSIVFGEHGELVVTGKMVYLKGYGGRIGEVLYEYDCWYDLLNIE